MVGPALSNMRAKPIVRSSASNRAWSEQVWRQLVKVWAVALHAARVAAHASPSIAPYVAYDITDDRRRTRVTKVLARHGRRVQYSVFLLPNATTEGIAAELSPLIAEKEDNVRI